MKTRRITSHPPTQQHLRSAAVVIVPVLCSVVPTLGLAELQTTGKGKSQELVAKQFSAKQQKNYQIFKVRCTKCHAMERPIAALTTGITPVTGGKFDRKGIKKYVVKMMRKLNSGIDKTQAKKIVVFLWYARELAKK